jgi:hypothetical protein
MFIEDGELACGQSPVLGNDLGEAALGRVLELLRAYVLCVVAPVWQVLQGRPGTHSGQAQHAEYPAQQISNKLNPLGTISSVFIFARSDEPLCSLCDTLWADSSAMLTHINIGECHNLIDSTDGRDETYPAAVHL